MRASHGSRQSPTDARARELRSRAFARSAVHLQDRKRQLSVLSKLDDHPHPRERGRRETVRRCQLARAILQALEGTVAVARLVVEEQELSRARGAREGDRVGDARMSPADVERILVLREL